jgi:hypothetical protein
MLCIGGEANYYQPPDPPPECRECDGYGKVEVKEYINAHRVVVTFYPHPKEIDCPVCEGTGY